QDGFNISVTKTAAGASLLGAAAFILIGVMEAYALNQHDAYAINLPTHFAEAPFSYFALSYPHRLQE
ncbi:MAG: hypothetical protein Q8N94_02420, partial [Methanoregula sp.]|nr:hypothetical protein [Methanoregula sp.]